MSHLLLLLKLLILPHFWIQDYPFILASERVDAKENVKLLLMFTRGTTEESDTPESPTPEDIEENLSKIWPNSFIICRYVMA